ncbi:MULTISPECIES: type II restriction endonuclease [Halorussus]|uniref:type II restriction endonuclease n=1 Tax=Halorussus TaxID=1070314 RepID=UPI00209DC081|nr:type II restriction endonuclease [Halorussus vallis]USZ74060.1 hypothetical protein NGM07_11395 [Halorussus vallis]
MQDRLDSYDNDVEPFDEDEFEQALHDYFDGFTWNAKGVIKGDGEVIPIPPVSNCVTAIFEVDAVVQVEKMADELGAKLIEPDHTRQYPDSTLIFEDKQIALDIKTARRSASSENRLKSPMTLGSYAGYFRNPTEESPWTTYPYGTYDDHWILCFAYRWDDDKKSLDMVWDIETLIGRKWEFASQSSGTGTTNAMGSMKDMEALRNREPVFDSEEDFEEYWRNYD